MVDYSQAFYTNVKQTIFNTLLIAFCSVIDRQHDGDRTS